MNKTIKYIVFFFLLLSKISAQVFIPLNQFFFEESIRKNQWPSIKPVVSDISLHHRDSLINDFTYPGIKHSNSWLIGKVRFESLLTVREKGFELNINPLIILETGRETKGENNIFRNTRGVFIQATLGKKLGFYSSFHENQSRFMNHVAGFADYYGIVPGQAFQKRFGDDAYDFAWSEGMVVYMPTPNLNFQFGHGKRFIGNGYRSMIYSDNAFNYPHFFMEYRKDKLKYATWFSSFMNPLIPYRNVQFNLQWQRKAGVFHYLTYQLNNILELGLFEGNIISSRDAKGNYTFYMMHYNPFILLNSISKKSNSNLGTNIQAAYKNSTFYLQYAINPHDAQKTAFQTGVKYNIILPHSLIKFQGEINHASKGIYTNVDTILSYTHYNQPLAHPLGENFTEYCLNMSVRIRSMEVDYRYIYANTFGDTLGYLPAINLFNTQENMISLDEASKRNIHDLSFSYIINPQYNLRLTLGIMYRTFEYQAQIDKNTFWYVGLQTAIFNKYYDF